DEALPVPTATSRSRLVPSGVKTSTRLPDLPEKSATFKARSSVRDGSHAMAAAPNWLFSSGRTKTSPFLGAANLAKTMDGREVMIPTFGTALDGARHLVVFRHLARLRPRLPV